MIFDRQAIFAFFYNLYPPLWDAIGAFLGDFAAEVITAYVISLVLLLVMTLRSLRRSKRVRAQLAAVEARKDREHV